MDCKVLVAHHRGCIRAAWLQSLCRAFAYFHLPIAPKRYAHANCAHSAQVAILRVSTLFVLAFLPSAISNFFRQKAHGNMPPSGYSFPSDVIRTRPQMEVSELGKKKCLTLVDGCCCHSAFISCLRNPPASAPQTPSQAAMQPT